MNKQRAKKSRSTSVRTRLLQSFSVLLGFLLMVSLLSLYRFDQLASTIDDLVDARAKQVLLTQKANQEAQSASIYLLRLLQTPTREQRVPLYLNMDAALLASDLAVKELTENQSSDLVEQVILLRDRYGKLFQTTVETIEISGLVTAREHFEQETDPVLQDLLQATLKLAEYQQSAMALEAERLQQNIAETRFVILLIIIASLLLSAMMAIIVAKSLSKPLERAVSLASAIASGDYSQQVPLSRLNEINMLFKSLSRMRDNIVQRERRIWRLAYTDALTGLPNRTQFLEELAKAVESGSGAMALLDLNRFAQINNALGHELGDQLLISVAERLSHCILQPNSVSRLNSDEFGILLKGDVTDDVEADIIRILQQLRDPIELQGQRLDIDACVGIAFYPDDAQSVNTLIKRASAALASAKIRHQGYAFAADFPISEVHEHLSLLGEMRHAIQQNEFMLEYQPKYDSRTHLVKSVEALVRWQHPERGRVSPGLFIPFAEQTGFIRDITEWVLECAISDLVDWQKQEKNIVVSVNISALDLISVDLVAQVKKLLHHHQVDPSLLCLEITESALMNDPDVAQSHLQQLADLGVRLSIDDYGASHASLAYVRDLPVHELKIDLAFISGIDHATRNAAIVWSTILLCRELGLTVVAEGVETQHEFNWLIAHECDVLQGFGIARPMSATQLLHWLSEQKLELSD